MKIKPALLLAFCLILATAGQTAAFSNNTVRGYVKPSICMSAGYRCILKQVNRGKYWCLKTTRQKTFDTRRTTTPIKKTRRENLGHCVQILPIKD